LQATGHVILNRIENISENESEFDLERFMENKERLGQRTDISTSLTCIVISIK
jgi:hypothetical protein